MEANIEKDDFLKAIDSVEKKNKPAALKKAKKEHEEKLITVKSIDQYKTNEIAVTINNFLSKNVDKEAGEVFFGENLARTGEYYGLKSNPVIGLIISTIGLVVIMFRIMIKKKKANTETHGGSLQNAL